jgi:hypothetical protein
VANLFTLFPSRVGRIPLETFFELMPLVKPRYYRWVFVIVIYDLI